jgi:LPS-assembly protein
VICRLVLLLALGTTVCVPAQPATPSRPEVTSDQQEFNAATGDYLLTGNVRMQDAGVLLLADHIVYNVQNEEVAATGHIVFTRGEVRLLADRLVYNRATGAFNAEHVRLGSHPYFVEGFSASGTQDEITVNRARASFGEPGPWQPTINADTLVFSPGRQLRSQNVTIGIGHTQPVPIPRFAHDLRAPILGAMSLTGGFRRSLGLFADGTLHIPVSPNVRVGADVGIFTNRGLLVGPSGRYQNAADPSQLRGYVRTGYINDHGDKKTDLLNRPVPEKRGFVEWQHEQVLAPNLTLTGQLHWWKDSEVVRDFRPRVFFPVQEPDTFLESVYSGPNYFLSAFARFQPNSFHRVQERLPEIRFDLLPLALGNGFYHRFHAGAAVLREDPPGGGTTLRSDRLDGYYTMLRPFAPREWLAFTPMAGGRITHYANTRGVARTGTYTRLLGEVGLDAALRGSGTSDYKNPQWKIDGLRHLVTPRLSYRYIPERDRGRAQIPRIDREVFSTYLQPLGLGEVRNIDDLHPTNTLRLALDNIVQTRDPVLGSRDLLVFNVANDFRFRRRSGERDVSEIHTELALMPARWLQVDVYQSFAPQTFTLREFNSGVTVRDGTRWSLRFGNNFLRDEIQDYSIDGRLRINERFDALTRLHYDARKRRFNEQAYGVVQNLGNTWLVSYTVSLYSGRRRESSFGFRVEIEAVRF